MPGTAVKNLLDAYFAEPQAPAFFTSLFQAPPANFYEGENVEIDIMRNGPAVAIAVQALGAGARQNGFNTYTSKEFTPPVYSEETPLNGFDLLKRSPGVNPYTDEGFQMKATQKALFASRQMEGKIRRAIELQAAQVLQAGVVDLKDSGGDTVYTIDYKAKGTHFPDASTAWDQNGNDKMADLQALIDVINRDGLARPDTLIFGSLAWMAFITDSKIQGLFENRRFELGIIAPQVPRGEGQTYMGAVRIGSYLLDCWVYDGFYTDPANGNATPYLADANVVVRSSRGRMDATFGAIPQLAPPDSRVLPFLPGRLSSSTERVDIFPYAYLAPNGQTLIVSAASRPLMIPTAIDTFGCLDTGL